MDITNSSKTEYIFYWFIENYSYCGQEFGESLVSPAFIVDKLDGTSWTLQLFPRGHKEKEKRGYISLYLKRSEEDDGPEKISLNYELAFLAEDGSVIESLDFEHEFERDYGYGCGNFVEMKEVLLQRKADYLPQGILTVRCKMWKGDGTVQDIGQSSARTRIKVERNSFLHAVENFSTLKLNIKHVTQIQSHSKKQCFISSSLYFKEDLCCVEKSMIEIVPSNTNKILCKCKFYLLDRSGNVIECGGTDYRHNAKRKKISKIPLTLSRQSILNQKQKYLPGDKLSLIYDCTFSSGIEFEAIEETMNEISEAVIKPKSYITSASIKNDCTPSEKLSNFPTVLEEMRALYVNQCFTDVYLKTETKSFPAHKIVLCAQSPVFKAMVINDMKEKINTDCIHVENIENNIVQQLLFFMYSDHIEDLQWLSATRLYYAAFIYEIVKLKKVCTTFLLQNLTTANALELLLLADTYNDYDLKKSVEDFILENDKEIFTSKEFDMLAIQNLQLAMKTMHAKYKRKERLRKFIVVGEAQG